MESIKMVKITNKKQFECLVKEMKKDKNVARGLKFAENYNMDKEEYEIAWKRVAEKLNSLGPPVRDVAGWQKVWTDFKLKVKKKLAFNRRELNATSGRPMKLHYLSPIEEIVVKILCSNKTVNYKGKVFEIPEINQPASASSSPTTSQDQFVNDDDEMQQNNNGNVKMEFFEINLSQEYDDDINESRNHEHRTSKINLTGLTKRESTKIEDESACISSPSPASLQKVNTPMLSELQEQTTTNRYMTVFDNTKKDDEYTIFGEFVANELKQMQDAPDLKAKLKLKIQTAILEISSSYIERKYGVSVQKQNVLQNEIKIENTEN